MTFADRKDVYELTPAQQEMFFHAQRAPGSQAYFEQIVYAYQGALDVPAFAQAWQRVIDRHPILRTSFCLEDGTQTVQLVHSHVVLPFATDDWRGLSSSVQEQRLAVFVEEDRRQGFDLGRAPLIRVTLVRMGEESYRFVVSNHHIIMDGWSMALVRSEVSRFYNARQCGGENELGPVRTFGEYVEWLRDRAAVEAEGFWRRTLGGFAAPNSLAIDHAPGALPVPDDLFAERETLLPTWLTADLQSFASEHRLTMSTLVQGAWAVLLSRYCGTDDVVFGVTVSGRSPELTGIESMLGLFSNIQPRRAHICQQDSVLSHFKNFQGQVVMHRAYEDSSLSRIQSWSEVPQDLPLFESLVMFEHFQTATAPLALGGQMEVSSAHLARTSCPLTLVACPGNRLRLQLIYHRSRFDDEAIERVLGGLSTMLEDMVENPQRSIERLEFLPEAERNKLLVQRKSNSPTTANERTGRALRLVPPGQRKAS
jgi:hypothetical protein